MGIIEFLSETHMYIKDYYNIMNFVSGISLENDVSANINILYVENNINIRKKVILNLEKENDKFKIDGVDSPNNGIHNLNKKTYDCILSGYNFPNTNGLEFLKEVKKQTDIPFILFTKENNDEIIHDIISENVDDYVEKDLNKIQYKILSKRISTYVSNHRTKSKLIKRTDELEEERKFINQSLDSMNDIFFVIDTNGNINKVNNSGLKCITSISNYSEQDIGEINIRDIFPQSQTEQINKSLSSVNKGNHVRFNIEAKTNQNESLELEIKISPLYNDINEIIGIVGMARDVTEENEYKRKLKKKNNKLDKFAKIISHDIRNPTSIAKGNLNLHINNHGSTDELDTTLKSIHRIENILEDVLYITKSNTDELNKQNITLKSIANECWKNLNVKNSELKINTDKIISQNKKLSSRLFENLFKNSIEHGGDNVRITIGGTKNGFYVEDNGTGIPKNKRGKIFNQNYSTSETGEGLGLSIVEHVCDLHEWTITITESKTGGARFEIDTNC